VSLHLFDPHEPQRNPPKPGEEMAQLVCLVGQIRLTDSGELIVETDPKCPPPPQFEHVLTHLQQELRNKYFLDAQGTPHTITSEIRESTPEGSVQRRLLVDHVDDATQNTVRAVPVTREDQEHSAALMRLTEDLFRGLRTPE